MEDLVNELGKRFGGVTIVLSLETGIPTTVRQPKKNRQIERNMAVRFSLLLFNVCVYCFLLTSVNYLKPFLGYLVAINKSSF